MQDDAKCDADGAANSVKSARKPAASFRPGRIWRRFCLGLASCLLVLTQSAFAEDQWIVAKTTHFSVYSAYPEKKIVELAQRLERVRDTLRLLLNAPDNEEGERLDVYVVRSHDEFNKMLPGVSDDILGVYLPSGSSISAIANFSSRNDLDPYTVLQHEYVHHFMLRNYPAAYPTWFTEGFAEYFSTVEFDGPKTTIGKFENNLARSLVYGNWGLINRTLRKPRPRDKQTDDEIGMLYAFGWAAVHYSWNDDKRRDALLKYLAAYDGTLPDQDASFVAATGLTASKFEDKVKSYIFGKLNGRTLTFPKTPQPAKVDIQRLSPGASANILATKQLEYEESGKPLSKTGMKSLEKLRAAADAFPDDPFVMVAAASAEIRFGDLEKGRALAKRAIELDPQNANAYYWLGVASEKAASTGSNSAAMVAEAKRYYAKAYAADPNHVPTLVRFAVLAAQTGAMNENTLNAALLAHQLAPQAFDVSLAVAPLLIRGKKYDEAIGVLTNVANSPHANDSRERALALIDEAEKALAEQKSTGANTKGSAPIEAVAQVAKNP